MSTVCPLPGESLLFCKHVEALEDVKTTRAVEVVQADTNLIVAVHHAYCVARDGGIRRIGHRPDGRVPDPILSQVALTNTNVVKAFAHHAEASTP